MPHPHRAEALNDDARLSDVCLSHTLGLSREQRPRKTKIGTEVAHVTCDSDTTFKVKRSKVNLQEAMAYCGGLPHSLFVLNSLPYSCVQSTCQQFDINIAFNAFKCLIQIRYYTLILPGNQYGDGYMLAGEQFVMYEASSISIRKKYNSDLCVIVILPL